MSRTYIGIDNGITGTIGIIRVSNAMIFKVPFKTEQDYTKKRQNISRIDCNVLLRLLESLRHPFAVIERPMINPGRWKASLSAIRCLEATLIVLDNLYIPYQFCDSKEWQKILLPKGTKDTDLKKISLQVGRRLFPNVRWRRNFKDADGLLIAEWARRVEL
jgi:hypothetical protein